MRYEDEQKSITSKMNDIRYSIVALVEKAYNDGVLHERERIRFAIAQYALDNKLDVKDIEPFINLVNGN